MTWKQILPALAAILGLAGGVLHGLDLAYGYDAADLPTGAPWLTALYILCVVSAVICITIAAGYPKTSNKYTAFETYLTGGGDWHKTIAVLCAAIFGLCGLIGLYYTATHVFALPLFERVTLIPLYLLAILSSLAFVRLGGCAARGTIDEQTAGLIFIPIFWSALDLVSTFKANGSTPMEGRFVFELLAAGSLLCALHAYARFLYATPRPRVFAVLGALGVVYGLTGGIGTLLCWILGGQADLALMPRAGCYLACAVWLMYQLTRMAHSKESRISM